MSWWDWIYLVANDDVKFMPYLKLKKDRQIGKAKETKEKWVWFGLWSLVSMVACFHKWEYIVHLYWPRLKYESINEERATKVGNDKIRHG